MKKVITDIEKEAGIVAYNPDRTKKIKTVEAILADYSENPEAYCGVNYTDRVLFLEDNGHEVTRENLVNPDLSANPKAK